MHEICNFMRRFTSRSPIFDALVTHCVTVRKRQKSDFLHAFVRDAISLVSQTGERDEILRTKLHISHIDQFFVPPILKYLIRAKDEEF